MLFTTLFVSVSVIGFAPSSSRGVSVNNSQLSSLSFDNGGRLSNVPDISESHMVNMLSMFNNELLLQVGATNTPPRGEEEEDLLNPSQSDNMVIKSYVLLIFLTANTVNGSASPEIVPSP